MRKNNHLLELRVCQAVIGLTICASVIACNKITSTDTPQVISQKPIPKLDAMRITHVPASTTTSKPKPIKCKLTAYCIENYPHICNDGDASTTATGTKPTPGRTVAVDPNIIPYFSNVIINGHTYIAEDCGGAIKGNRVDIVFATHQEALDFGVQYAEVYVKEKD